MGRHSFPSSPSVALLLAALAAGAAPASRAQATTLTYDADSSTAGIQDGTTFGWTAGAANWRNETTTTDNQTWVDGSDAVFGGGTAGTAGTVNLGGAVTVNSLTFNAPFAGNYTIANGGNAANTLTLSGPTVTANAAATISAVVAGSAGLTKEGSGTLTLSNATNTYTGGTSVNAGTLQANTTGSLAGAVAIGSSGTLALKATGTPTYGNAISGTGTIRAYAGGTGSSTTTLSGDLTNFTGVLDINTSTGSDGGQGKVALNGASLISSSALIKVEQGATVYLAKSGTYANAFQLYGGATTTGEQIGNLRIDGSAVSGTVTLFGNSSIGAASANTGTVSGNIVESGGSYGLTFSGNTGGQTIVLSGQNTYSGATTIANGTLRIGGAGTLGSGNYAGNISNAGTLQYSSTASQTFSGTISGTGKLTKDTGTGTLTLTGANTYTGATTITAGTLSVAAIGNGGVAGNLGQAGSAASNLVFGGGTLQYTGSTATTDRAFTVSAASTLEVTNAGAALTIANNTALAGGGQILTKTGAGTLVLGGTADNSSFFLSVGAGTVELAKTVGSPVRAVAGFSAIASGATVKLTGAGTDQIYGGNAGANYGVNGLAGTLDLNGHSESTSNFNGVSTGKVTNSAAATSATWTVGETNATSSFAGVIENGSGTVALTKIGTGTQTLSGTNTYTGATTLAGGTLALGSVGALNGTSAITFTGGTLQYSGSNATDYSGKIVNSTGAIAIDTNGQNVTFASALGASNTGGLAKSGAGTLTLANTNTYTGATNVQNGTLSVANLATNLASTSGITIGVAGATTGTLTYTGTGEAFAKAITMNGNANINANGASGTLALAGTFANTNGSAATAHLTLGGTGSGSMSAAIADKDGTHLTDVTKTGSGTWTLSGASNYTGATAVNGGTLNLTGSLASAVTVASGAILAGTGTTIGDITFNAGSAVVAGATGVQGANVTANATTNIFVTGAPTGSPTTVTVVRHTGTMTGLANFTPATNYRAGSITDTAGSVSLTYTGEAKTWNDADGTWDIGTSTPWVGGDAKFYWGDSVTFGAITADRVATLTGTLAPSSITVNNAANKYTLGGTGSIAGASTLTKAGSGTLVLATANTYTGGTAIGAGRVVLGNAAGLGAGMATVASGAALDVAGLAVANPIFISGSGDGTVAALYNSSVAAGGSVSSLKLNADASVGSAIANDYSKQFSIGGLDLNGYKLTIASGTIGMGLSNVPNGDIDINSGGRLVLTTGGSQTKVTGTITVNAGGILDTRDSDNSGAISAHTIALNGGTLGNGLSANNNGGGIGAKLKNNITVDAVNGGTITGGGVFGNTFKLYGGLSGSGALTVNGNGVEFLGDVSGYTGTVSGGTGKVVFNTAAPQVFNGVLAGARAITKSGAGTTTLTNTNTYSSTTTINAGTLQIGNGAITGTLGTGAVVINNTGTLALNRTDNASLGATSTSGGTLSMNDGSTLKNLAASNTTISGYSSGGNAVTFTGTDTLSAAVGGSLAVVGYGANAFAHGLQFTSGAVLNSTGSVTLTGIGSGSANTRRDIFFNGNTTLNNNSTDASVLTITNSQTGSNDVAFWQNSGTITTNGRVAFDIQGYYNGTAYWTCNSGGTTDLSFAATSGTLTLNAKPTTYAFDIGNTIGNADLVASSGATIAVTGTAIGVSASKSIQTGEGALTIDNDIKGSSAGLKTLTIANMTGHSGGTVVLSGALSNGSGQLALTQNASGTTTLSGTNTYTGATTLAGGTLALGSAGALNGTSAITFTGGTLQYSGSNTADYSGKIASSTGAIAIDTNGQNVTFASALGASNTGGLSKTGAGTLALAGNNSYTGLTTVSAGTLEVAANNALGTNAAGTTVASGGTLKLTNVNYTTTEAISINGTGAGGAGALLNSGTSTYAGAVTVASNATINNGGGTLNLTGGINKTGTTVTFSGAGTTRISGTGLFGTGGTPNSDVVINGASQGTTVILDADSFFNGNVSVTNTSSLFVNANLNTVDNVGGGAGTGGTGTVTVDGTSRLGGFGSITTASLSVAGGGQITGGAFNSLSGTAANNILHITTTTGGMVLQGTYLADINYTGQSGNQADGVRSDVVSVTGNVDLTGATLALTGTDTPAAAGSHYAIKLFEVDAGSTITGDWASVTFNGSSLAPNQSVVRWGNAYYLVPEPASFALLGLGGLLLLRRPSRRRGRAA